MTHWHQGDEALISKVSFPNSLYRIVAQAFELDLLSGKCHKTLQMRSHIGSCNGLVTSDNKPLPKPMLAEIYRHLVSLGSKELTQWGWDNMATILQTTLSNSFSWMKITVIFWKIPLKFVPKSPINNKATLIQRMACCRIGNKTQWWRSSILTHICVIWPQWVKESSQLRQEILRGSFTENYINNLSWK